jgi:tRNA modification GTPase
MPIRNDTIAAIATPIGEGAIGIVRLSGPEAGKIARSLFDGRLIDHRLTYGHIIHPETAEPVDEVMAVLMRSPRTYTREDTVEFHGHGGPAPLQSVLSLCLRQGARQAEPGEFTLRAFLNGRLDLSQAEAVLDIIQAKTEASLRLAVDGLQGRLSQRLHAVRNDLIEILAHLTARIDFPDDDVPAIDLRPRLARAAASLRALLQSAESGIIYRQGLRLAIVGLPNVGKSSLLNRLLGTNRAIVTDIPGTTRDTLEETMSLRGVPIILTDTAGMREEAADVVERLGIERSRRALEQADMVLVVLDGSRQLAPAERDLLAGLPEERTIIAVNKSDLPPVCEADAIGREPVRVSALHGDGMADLEDALYERVVGGHLPGGDTPWVTNVRHKEALERACRHIADALASVAAHRTDDLVAIDVTAAVGTLGEITGESVTEDLLDTIFSRFCIGK